MSPCHWKIFSVSAKCDSRGSRRASGVTLRSYQPISFSQLGSTRASERLGDELRAEADAENRNAALDGLAHQADLGLEMRVLVDLVDVHRAAEKHEPAVAVEGRLGVRVAAEVHVADTEAGALEERVERAEDLVGDVLADEKLAHDR